MKPRAIPFGRTAILAAAISVGATAGAFANGTTATYPNQSIRWIVQAPPGGITDALARTVADGLQKRLKTPVVVESRPGGLNLIGTNMALKAAADGYTLVSFPSQLVTGPFLYADGRFPADPLKVLKPLSILAQIPNAVLVAADSPLKSFDDFKAKYQKDGGALYGSPGAGSIVHMAGESLKAVTGIKADPVHYSGSSPVSIDLVGGQVPFAIDNIPPYLSFLKEGRVRALAILGQKRSALLPDVPHMGELGYPDYEGNGWQGVAVRSETSPEIVQALEQAIQDVMADPEVRAKLERIGFIPVGSNADDGAQWIKNEMERWGGVIRANNIKIGE